MIASSGTKGDLLVGESVFGKDVNYSTFFSSNVSNFTTFTSSDTAG